MKKTVIEWRKATAEELEKGSDEMVLVREFETEVESENQEVELWKLKGILTVMGLVTQIETALDTLQEPNKTLAKIAWSNGNVVHSNSDTCKFIQSVLKLSDEQVYDIFTQAQSILI